MSEESFSDGRKFLSDSENPGEKDPPEPLPEAGADEEPVKLPEHQDRGGMPLWGALRKRRSRRRFSGKALELETLSQLLWATQGLSRKGGTGRPLRTTPSAGACYPLDLYVLANAVTGVRPGLYRYDEMEHRLLCVSRGEFGKEFQEGCMGQEMVADCQVAFIWVGVEERLGKRYGLRAYRYLFLDTGHAAENLALAAESLGLGCCPIGAFTDSHLNALMGLDGVEQTVVYMTVVGRTR